MTQQRHHRELRIIKMTSDQVTNIDTESRFNIFKAAKCGRGQPKLSLQMKLMILSRTGAAVGAEPIKEILTRLCFVVRLSPGASVAIRPLDAQVQSSVIGNVDARFLTIFSKRQSVKQSTVKFTTAVSGFVGQQWTHSF